MLISSHRLAVVDLLYMHRSFFARALSDHPKDPLGSPYGTSVIAAYRSAGSLVALIRNLHSQAKEPIERMWFLWTHMFSCAVSMPDCIRLGMVANMFAEDCSGRDCYSVSLYESSSLRSCSAGFSLRTLFEDGPRFQSGEGVGMWPCLSFKYLSFKEGRISGNHDEAASEGSHESTNVQGWEGRSNIAIQSTRTIDVVCG